MRSLFAVSSSDHCIRSTSAGSRPWRRPMYRIRTPSAFSSGVSEPIRSPIISIRARTSSSGRLQFSVENEYTVSSSIPSSAASRSRAFSVSAPARWPSMTGSPRWLAQRPLPSVMIATYLGAVTPATRPSSNFEDLFFLALQEGIDLGDRVVGLFLQRRLGPALVVLADVALFFQLAQVAHDVAADVADRDAAFLGHPVHHLDHLPPALLGHLRDLQADQVAVVARREADIGLLDRLLDRPQAALIERGHRQQAGV